MARRSQKDQGQDMDNLNTGAGTKMVRDLKGNLVEVPVGTSPEGLGGKFIDWSIPQEDDDGSVPQFVNMTGKKAIVKPPYGAAKIEVSPWGVLEGAQFRHTYATSPDGMPPKFQERKEGVVERTEDNPKGYDPDYLLTEEQVAWHAKHWRGGGATGQRDAIKIDKEFTIKRLQGLLDNGKLVPGKPGNRERDMRSDVYQTINDMKSYVQMRLQLQELGSGVEMNEPLREQLVQQLQDMRVRLFGE